jgi:hypothetical protein
MTQREYLARMAWLEEEQDRPSRADWYAMQTAMEVRRTAVKDPQSVKLADMQLKREVIKPNTTITKEGAAAIARARWYPMLGVKKPKKKD